MSNLSGALCADLPEAQKAWFYTDERKSNAGSIYKKAQAICKQCPVRTACLNAAMEMEGQGIGVFEGRGFGVWGGVSARARARLAKESANEMPAA